ncbi:protein-tyrosine phosphatase-like protein [Aspergillus heterothallicus]
MGKAKRPSAGAVLPDFLYLGPASAASDISFLRAQRITTIISIGKTPPRKYDCVSTDDGTQQITYHRLSLEDKESADIGKCVDAVCGILDAASSDGGRVLVHCSAAISRSPAVVAGYLIRRRGLSLEDGLQALRAARSVVAPNRGFLEQLQKMEAEQLNRDEGRGEEGGGQSKVDQD